MPLITLTVRKPKPVAFTAGILDAVHAALLSIGVPENDRFQRVIELDADHFRFDATYPDLASPRGEDFVLIEVLLSAGRSVKVKKQFLAQLIADLAARGHDPEHVMVVFNETTWENWSFGGGRLIHT